MRLVIRAGFLLLALVLSALGDEMSVDVRTYGALGDGVRDNGPAIRSAIRVAKSKLAGTQFEPRVDLKFPGSPKPYLISRPIVIDEPGIWIVGDGPQSIIRNSGFGPAIVVGVRTSEPGPGGTTVALDASHRVPRAGKLDGSHGGFGIRTKDSTIVFAGTPFDLGPPEPLYGQTAWGGDTITIDLAIERNTDAGQWLPGKVEGILLLGGYGSPTILGLQKGGGANQVDLIVADARGQRGTVSCVLPNPGPLVRLTVQVNLRTKVATAWVDRVQVTTTTAGVAFSVLGAGSFQRNERDCLILNGSLTTNDGRPTVANPDADLPDWTIFGLNLSAYQKYRVGAVGSPQRTADGGPVTDGFAYGAGDAAHTVAMLWGDRVETLPSPRFVDAFSGTNGWKLFYGYQFQKQQGQVLGGQGRNGIRDVQLISSSDRLCPTVQLFGVLDFRAERCRIRGGTQAIGTIHGTASYPITISDCDLEGSDSCIFAAWSLLNVLNTRFDRIGRAAVRTWASDTNIIDTMLHHQSPNTDHVLAAHGGLYGGHHVIRRMAVDFEGDACRVSPLLIDQSPWLFNSLSVEDTYWGNASKGKPLVLARTVANPLKPLRIDLRRFDDPGGMSKLVESDRPVSITNDLP